MISTAETMKGNRAINEYIHNANTCISKVLYSIHKATKENAIKCNSYKSNIEIISTFKMSIRCSIIKIKSLSLSLSLKLPCMIDFEGREGVLPLYTEFNKVTIVGAD